MKYFEKAMATIQIKQQVVENFIDASLAELHFKLLMIMIAQMAKFGTLHLHPQNVIWLVQPHANIFNIILNPI
jgi:hypothetical protein